MTGENEEWKHIKDILKEFDSSERFYPKNFDFRLEDKRAYSLAGRLEKAMKVKAKVEDYSLNQDGSRFLIINLIDENLSCDVAQVSISSFGRLVTIENASPKHLDMIKNHVMSEHYIYIPLKYLENMYDGNHQAFKGDNWYYRYFTPWYRAAAD
jgi:hypothetical protein